MIDEQGWTHTCHPMPKEDNARKFVRDLLESYEEKGREVKDVLSYYNSNYDPVTCPASWLWNADLRPEPTYGYEIVWKEKEVNDE